MIIYYSISIHILMLCRWVHQQIHAVHREEWEKLCFYILIQNSISFSAQFLTWKLKNVFVPKFSLNLDLKQYVQEDKERERDCACFHKKKQKEESKKKTE